MDKPYQLIDENGIPVDHLPSHTTAKGIREVSEIVDYQILCKYNPLLLHDWNEIQDMLSYGKFIVGRG